MGDLDKPTKLSYRHLDSSNERGKGGHVKCWVVTISEQWLVAGAGAGGGVSSDTLST